MQGGRVIHNIINGVQKSKSISASRSGMVPPVKQITMKMRQLFFFASGLQPSNSSCSAEHLLTALRRVYSTGNRHYLRRFSKTTIHWCSFSLKFLLRGSALGNVKPPSSQTAAGARGRLPRAASTQRFPRAGQAPPDPVHASRSCGARCGDAGRARWALGVRSPKCSEREGARDRLCTDRRRRRRFEEARRFRINPLILG